MIPHLRIRFFRIALPVLPLALLAAPRAKAERTFGEDAAFLQAHTKSVVLGAGDGKIVVTPEYQGRVMTSTTGGADGPSFGWINYKLIEQGVLGAQQAKGKLEEHIYVFGGEERFWMGPEGGQFAIFFKAGAKFDFDSWKTPAVIDTEPFELASKSATQAVFTRDFEITNYSGTAFKVGIRRTVRVLDQAEAEKHLATKIPPGVEFVAYETDNRMTNRGDKAWEKKTGLLSIWLLGMYKPGPEITTVIPIVEGAEDKLGPRVNDAYFGKVPAEKLVVRDKAVFFSGDGTHRSKIGISPRRSTGTAGSYDAAGGVLNIVIYNLRDADEPYVNSMWELQKQPYAGDAINSYNDGPPAPGQAPLGPFYELETSSPAAELKPGETTFHLQQTYHIKGGEKQLDPLARKLLGVSIGEIKSALK